MYHYFLYFSSAKVTFKYKTRQIKRIVARSNSSAFINFLCKRGLKLKTTKKFNFVIHSFYNLFNEFNYELSKSYKTYQMLFNFSEETSSFFQFNFLINFLLSFLTPVFDIKISKISSKIRKRRKIKKKIAFSFKYLLPWQRRRWFIYQLIIYSWSFTNRSLVKRIYNALTQTIFLEKKSELYLLKIKIYEFVLSKKKTQFLD